jgi:hypothetical protein
MLLISDNVNDWTVAVRREELLVRRHLLATASEIDKPRLIDFIAEYLTLQEVSIYKLMRQLRKIRTFTSHSREQMTPSPMVCSPCY